MKDYKQFKTPPGFLYPSIPAVLDKFQGMSNAEINAELDKTRLPYAVLMEQFASDNNFGNVVRSANAFGAKEVFYLKGNKGYNRVPTCGSYHYVPVKHIKTYEEIKDLKEKYVFIGLDCNVDCQTIDISRVPWKKLIKPPMLILGEEQAGITKSTQQYVDFYVEIKMIGAVRSINVASAAAIAMYSIMNGLS